MTDPVEPAAAYGAWLDATVGLEPALIEAERFAVYLTTLLQSYDDKLTVAGKVSTRRRSDRLPHGVLTMGQAPIAWEVDEARRRWRSSTRGRARFRWSPCPGVRVKQGPREVCTAKPALEA